MPRLLCHFAQQHLAFRAAEFWSLTDLFNEGQRTCRLEALVRFALVARLPLRLLLLLLLVVAVVVVAGAD